MELYNRVYDELKDKNLKTIWEQLFKAYSSKDETEIKEFFNKGLTDIPNIMNKLKEVKKEIKEL